MVAPDVTSEKVITEPAIELDIWAIRVTVPSACTDGTLKVKLIVELLITGAAVEHNNVEPEIWQLFWAFTVRFCCLYDGAILYR
jgi:hypothetical protein